MDITLKRKALTKLAFFGSAWVPGAPTFHTPAQTVGQMLYNVNNISMPSQSPARNDLFLNSSMRRSISDHIVGTGLNVNSPAKSLLHAGVGALAGNFIANTLKTGPFVRGLMTAAGANYGYNH